MKQLFQTTRLVIPNILRTIVAAFAVGTLVCAGCEQGKSDLDIRMVAIDAVRRDVASGSVVLVDARPPEQFAAGRLPGARNLVALPSDRALDPAIANAQNVIVYGENPGSPLAKGLTKRLLERDVKVRYFAGGFEEWVAQGGQVEKP